MLVEYSPHSIGRVADAKDALILSQFARLHLRLRQPDQAALLFADALEVGEQLSDRKASVVRAMVALDQARGLWLGRAQETLELVTESIVAEPIGSEITQTERTIKNQLPKAMRDQAVLSGL